MSTATSITTFFSIKYKKPMLRDSFEESQAMSSSCHVGRLAGALIQCLPSLFQDLSWGELLIVYTIGPRSLLFCSAVNFKDLGRRDVCVKGLVWCYYLTVANEISWNKLFFLIFYVNSMVSLRQGLNAVCFNTATYQYWHMKERQKLHKGKRCKYQPLYFLYGRGGPKYITFIHMLWIRVLPHPPPLPPYPCRRIS